MIIPAPYRLTVGDRGRPLCVEGAPAFGWQLRPSHGWDGRQGAYRLQVVDAAGGGTIWDSGLVPSRDQSYVRYRGPALAPATAYRWRVRVRPKVADAVPSAWSRWAAFETGMDNGGWGAAWIRRRPRDEDDRRDDYTLFRRALALGPSPIVRARAYVATQHQHVLWVNGHEVARGPAFAYPDEGYYQAVDVDDALTPGRPAVVGAVTHWYGPGQGRPEAAPGFLLRLVVEHRDGSCEVVVTGGGWRARRGPWRPAPYRNGDGRDYIEDVDGREWPQGWLDAGFDDGAWDAAEEVGPHPVAPFLRLRGQEADVVSRPIAPVRVSRVAGGVVADFGQIVAARPRVRFRAGVDGRTVSMAAGYLLDEDGAVSRTSGVQKTDLSYRYTQRDGDQTFQALTYLGFRYLEVGRPLAADSVDAVQQHVDAGRAETATFACSEPVAGRVFHLAMHSALHSSQWQFLDTPTREKGQFLADAADISRALMAGFRDRALTRQAIVDFVASQRRYWPDGRLNAVYPNGDGRRDIPDFTEMFCAWVWDYYVESGDAATLALAYPAMAAVCEYVLRHLAPATGLVTRLSGGSGPYAEGIVDWPPAMRYGHDMDVAARTSVNLLAVDALRHTARAADAMGCPPPAVRRFASAADALAGAINARLRRPSDGMYVDGLKADGTPSAHASQIANAYALAFDVVPPADRAAVAAYVAGLGTRMGPMTALWLLEALGRAGRVDAVLERIVDAESPGWANILARGATFTWESWNAPETGNSLSHGWGSTVLVAIQRHLLGVAVTAPGAARVRVRPALGALAWARGRVPTQRGPVRVAWRRAGREITLDVDVPPNVDAYVELPGGDEIRVGPDGLRWNGPVPV